MNKKRLIVKKVKYEIIEIVNEFEKETPFVGISEIFVDEISSNKTVEYLKDVIKENQDNFDWAFNSEPTSQYLHVLQEMIKFHLTQGRIHNEEEFHDLIEKKVIYFDSIRDVLWQADIFLGIYSIYMKKPWSIDSNVCLVYQEIEPNEFNDSEYADFLPLEMIREQLLPYYGNQLEEADILSADNLLKMLIFKAVNDSDMDLERLMLKPGDKGYEDIYKTENKGGYAVWGGGQFNYLNL